ncbi:MAG: type I-U CRISPR-associated helicase/endonuclease Cas3 [Chloroflexi bacterium]|nr:type I-U CRISPR-associated helicase/endonuclease Cas3 [Chloroflexota bacterium]
MTGFSPMNWQHRLYECFVANDLPDACDIPTGLGKTSILVIWLLALVQQAEDGKISLPRRLIYIVNRRTVVDQATEVAECLRRRLLEPEAQEWRDHSSTLSSIAETLASLCAADGVPLAVSTLRGEFADNEEWKANPARPAIIIGTIDMIGSKLLFSGYGDGRYDRAHHAGLIGQDTLIVHDEAHLTPAFSDLLNAIEREQIQENERNGCQEIVTRPIRVIELSATPRRSEANPRTFTLKPEDEVDETAGRRLAAVKSLYLHHQGENSSVEQKIVELSKAHESTRAKVLIYVLSPERARQVQSYLTRALGKQADERIALLTGTMRGHERDKFVKANPVYHALLNHDSPVERAVYLISTSAGEVGVDLDADHMVCDLTTLDALIQRLGRVNRRGDRCNAQIDVVWEGSKGKPSKIDDAIASTLSLLRQWKAENDDINVSPKSLRQLLEVVSPEVKTAFSPKPEAPPLTDILLDSWSLTSLQKLPGRLEVAGFLHGLTHDPPDTFVAWRKEISTFDDAKHDQLLPLEFLSEWFRVCRIEARERLHDRTDHVKKELGKLLEKHQERDSSRDFRVVILDEHGEAKWAKLSEITKKDFNLDFRTVILPVEAQGLDTTNGMLDASAVEHHNEFELDVYEVGGSNERRVRLLHYPAMNGEGYKRLLTGDTFDISTCRELREVVRIPLRQSEESEEETIDLVLLASPLQSALKRPEMASARQTLKEHTETAAKQVSAIVEKLGLPEAIQGALIIAARRHDDGKKRAVWQYYAQNANGTVPLAKSPRYRYPRVLGGYRHEFGSLLDAMNDHNLACSAERDLVLHLIAAHHGWARPYFEEPRSYDSTYLTATNSEAAREALRRFERLQQRFGRWGLAWLESLLRCADITASQQAITPTAPPLPEETA